MATFKLYEKANIILVKDGFNWANPKSSKMPRPLLLHGTSGVLIEPIKREGLRFTCPLLTPSELYAVKNCFISENSDPINSPHTISKTKYDPATCLTTSPSIAIHHAISGPEILERIRGVILERQERGVSLPAIIERILDKIETFYHEHKPFVLFIDAELYSVDYEIIKKLKRLWRTAKPSHLLPSNNENITRSVFYKLKEKGFSEAEAIQSQFRDLGFHRSPGSYQLYDDTLTNGTIPPAAIKNILEITDELLTILKVNPP